MVFKLISKQEMEVDDTYVQGDNSLIYPIAPAVNAMRYLIGKFGGEMDFTMLIRLLRIADAIHLQEYGRTISRKLTLGRACAGLKFIDTWFVALDQPCNRDWLSETDVECLDKAIEADTINIPSQWQDIDQPPATLTTYP